MSLFKKKWYIKLVKRFVISKGIGFGFGFLWFIYLYFLNKTGLMFNFGLLLWYTSMWAIIWIFGIITKHPIFNFKINFLCRWIFIWAWLNLVLTLFMYNDFIILMQWTFLEWYSPFWAILEWMIVWVTIEYFATKYAWEGKNLLK